MDSILIRTVKSHTRPIWRCGRKFDRNGQELERTAFTDEEWERVARDPALEGIDPETEEVLFSGGKPVKGDDASIDDSAGEIEELRQRISDAIRGLAPDGFTKGGAPDLKALKAALPDDADKITGALRDGVWAAMIDEGFVTPTEPNQT